MRGRNALVLAACLSAGHAASRVTSVTTALSDRVRSGAPHHHKGSRRKRRQPLRGLLHVLLPLSCQCRALLQVPQALRVRRRHRDETCLPTPWMRRLSRSSSKKAILFWCATRPPVRLCSRHLLVRSEKQSWTLAPPPRSQVLTGCLTTFLTSTRRSKRPSRRPLPR